METKKQKGIVEDRSCTDILCCLIFIAAIGAFIVVASISYKDARPEYLTATWDSSGNPCGLKQSLTGVEKDLT